MKKPTSYFILGIAIGCIISSLFFAALSRNFHTGEAGARSVQQLKLGHALPTTHPVHAGIEFMAERLKELSGGAMEIIIFPSEQMGDETKCIEQVQMGTLAMTKTSSAPMGNFVEVLKVFSLPYLFRDADHYWTVLEGPIGKEMLQRLATRDDGRPSGFIGLGYFDSGSRNFYSTSPIYSPQDMRGKKYRVMRDPVAMDMVQAMGGSPTPIPWGELYTALKQGVVDGAENNPPSIISSRHSEICKYLTLDAHSRIPDIVIISEKIWGRLSPQEQVWLEQAMQEATVFQRDLWAKSTQEALEQMQREDRVEILEVDLAPFRQAVQPVIDKYATGDIRDIYDRIQDVQ
ncbi:MAG: TRAP transporter substrate-binding protein [Puniceicoccaceae bacterium]